MVYVEGFRGGVGDVYIDTDGVASGHDSHDQSKGCSVLLFLTISVNIFFLG